jgi:dTDP-4-dehydrorhamnose 3,5-epimerase
MSLCREGPVDGRLTFEGDLHQDERGYFLELFNPERLGCSPLPKFVQWNASYSEERVLRGFHLQDQFPQGKLVRALQGHTTSFGIDLRPRSPSFLNWSRVELRAGNAVYWPPGIAHALFVSWGPAYIVYACTEEWSPRHDGGVRWNDPELGLPLVDVLQNMPKKWAAKISAKDAALPGVREYLETRGIYGL